MNIEVIPSKLGGLMDATHPQEYLTVRQLAELLQVPAATVYQWRYRGEGPRGIRLSGRHVRYSRREVDRFLAEHADAPRTTA
jgi:excisionase family DNA binding protein